MIEDALSFWTEIQRFENMLAADPRSYCFVPLSELYRKLGLLDDAVSVAARGCALHPDYPGGFFALGSAYLAKGEKTEAREALERAVALKPDHVEALKLLGQLYVEDGRMDLAARVLRRVLQENPDDTESAVLLNSIAPQSAAQPEEVFEDLEIIDDLEIVEEAGEELGAPSPTPAPQSAIAFSDEWGFEPEEGDLVEESDASADFWAIGSPKETAPAEAAGQRRKDPLTTATMAELYLSQGFFDRALTIYQDLAAAEPANVAYRTKVAELKGLLEQASPPAAAPAPTPVEEVAPQPVKEVAPKPMEKVAPQPEVALSEAPLPEAGFPEAAFTEAAFTEAGVWGDGQAAAEPEEPKAEGMAAAGPVDLESALNRWLENIRRRRDGV